VEVKSAGKKVGPLNSYLLITMQLADYTSDLLILSRSAISELAKLFSGPPTFDHKKLFFATFALPRICKKLFAH